jgi:hypothetical protein
MNKPNDGGPAFPTATTGKWAGSGDNQVFAPDMTDGMTLRDYFAAAALPGIIQRDTERAKWELANDCEPAAVQFSDEGQVICSVPPCADVECSNDPGSWEHVAAASYAAADAMLAERAKGGAK